MKHGLVFITEPGSDKKILEVDTLQCCHCGGHFALRPGSGNVRGFCARCNGPVCGPGCAACLPMEARLENAEAGRPADAAPRIIVRGW